MMESRDALETFSETRLLDHFGHLPENVTWCHVSSLEHYAAQLKRITDMAFSEGEHAS